MRNATRRNRNIGTSSQGFGQNNKQKIADGSKYFVERLVTYTKQSVVINGHTFIFVTEATREDAQHACSVNDITRVIEHIPVTDYGDMKFIILRQPKRKEETLSQVWGRLIYAYEFEGVDAPAVILEAQSQHTQIKWPGRLRVSDQKELERLKEDGFKFINDGRHVIADCDLAGIRRTQLYRTLLHEFGHYVHYMKVVDQPGSDNEEYEVWEQRYEYYHSIPSAEKEDFAHRYADKLRRHLIEQKVIPFEPLD